MSTAPLENRRSATERNVCTGRYIAYARKMTGPLRRRYWGTERKRRDARRVGLVVMAISSKTTPECPPWMMVSSV